MSGKKITIVTALPKDVVQSLTRAKRVSDINTIPSISKEAIRVIRDYFVENVGFDDLPIACLSKLDKKKINLKTADSGLIESSTFPAKANETMLLEFLINEDLVVSVDLADMLDASAELNSAVDECEKDRIRKRLSSKLSVGVPDGDEFVDVLSFVPFLDLSACQYFAIVNEAFDTTVNRWETKEVSELRMFFKEA